jgi:hypothetical protein
MGSALKGISTLSQTTFFPVESGSPSVMFAAVVKTALTGTNKLQVCIGSDLSKIFSLA